MNIFRVYCLCTFIALCSWGGIASAQIVEIPDPNLKREIQKALGLDASVAVTQQDMHKLTRLHKWAGGITDLTGLEHAINLENLHLCKNEFVDLSPISKLKRLRELKLCWNLIPISDISALAGLTALEFLDLNGNQIQDISALANLAGLKQLWLSGNRIVDITSLAHLTALVELQLNNNRITDVSPLANLPLLESLYIRNNPLKNPGILDGLSLHPFERDEICTLPIIPIHDRLQNRTFPSVFSPWAFEIPNRPHLSRTEGIASHDLFIGRAYTGVRLRETDYGWKLMGDPEEAARHRETYLSLNPNIIFIYSMAMRAAIVSNLPGDVPESFPYWIRDAQGNIVPTGWAAVHFPEVTDGLIDFTHPGAQDWIVQRVIAVAESGLYDGIFFDHWHDEATVLKGWRTLEQEQQARTAILQRIRAAVRPDFLIMGNANRSKIPRNAPYMNGSFMETGNDYEGGYTHEGLIQIESTLSWLEQNLRAPQINCLEGWGIPTELPNSPRNLRFMRIIITLSLTHSDGYVLYIDGKEGHQHLWYSFWDTNLGKPIGAKAQTYGDVEGLFIREFTNGWAVYNRSGQAQTITLPSSAISVSDRGSTAASITHLLPDLDGEIYLKTKHPADVNGDGAVNILDLVMVANGLGQSAPDPNGDGVVNILDLVFVAQQFSQ